jgi:hypothetical protein
MNKSILITRGRKKMFQEPRRRTASASACSSTSKSPPSALTSGVIVSGRKSMTKSMSLVARGSPWSELARLPPRK